LSSEVITGETSPELRPTSNASCSHSSDCGQHVGRIALRQHHISGFNGYGRASSDRDAKVSLRQSSSIINPVTDHGGEFAPTFGLELANTACFVFGQHFCEDAFNANLPGNRLRRSAELST